VHDGLVRELVMLLGARLSWLPRARVPLPIPGRFLRLSLHIAWLNQKACYVVLE